MLKFSPGVKNGLAILKYSPIQSGVYLATVTVGIFFPFKITFLGLRLIFWQYDRFRKQKTRILGYNLSIPLFFIV
ncbi:MAG: hypothetical protein MGF17_15385 [Trichodesmium sp. MAG_R04]|nr:hypothetical protein [Trichodesmium sp. MAG_R04]